MTKQDWANAALSVYVSRLAQGRRVCVVGAPRHELVEQLGPICASVRAAPAAPAGKYDLVIVPDVTLQSFVDAGGFASLRAALGEKGVFVGGVFADATLTYEELFERTAAVFPHVRMAGQAAFAGYSIADFGVTASPSIVFDGTLLGEEGELPTRFFAVGSFDEVSIDAYSVVQVPASTQIQTVEVVGAAPAPVVVEPDINEEVVALEKALHEQAALLREARAEAERRGTLARDLVEELAELRKAGGDAASPILASREPDLTDRINMLEREKRLASTRALEAEAKRTEAVFRADELRAREAELTDSLRASRARASEHEELHSSIQARYALTQQDLQQALDKIRVLERELAEARDQVELDIVRTHSEPAAPGQVRSTLDELARSVRESVSASRDEDDD
ncbi:MAG: hypothetical protein IPK60_03650 [Sandaracinaceae bacterium]|nr:hypothetical protein [Sandaracinaceae bacterium]